MQETVTIINNSGKIIATGKQLVGIFKEAKASYQEKKAAVKSERALQRAQTFDVAPKHSSHRSHRDRKSTYDDTKSRRSQSSHRSKSSRHHKEHHHRDKDRGGDDGKRSLALTEANLKALTETSEVGPSAPPRKYLQDAPSPLRYSMTVHRARSDPSLRHREKDAELHMAYGEVPPNLADRVDLDPAWQAQEKERKAQQLAEKVEDLLDEANCLHHTASSIIKHLQEKPEAAAAVALTLAELSHVLAKMSPAFLATLKGGMPAVFALLASPQFLIGAGVAVGVTVVMFGGWKIVKHMRETSALKKEAAMAFSTGAPSAGDVPAAPPGSLASNGVDDALVLEEELSGIESWRRGIAPFGEDEEADLELISPEAHKSLKEDALSHSGRTHRSSRTHKSSKTHRSSQSRRTEVPERKSSKNATVETVVSAIDGESIVDSERSSRRSSKGKRKEMKLLEDGRADRERDGLLKGLFKRKEREHGGLSVVGSAR